MTARNTNTKPNPNTNTDLDPDSWSLEQVFDQKVISVLDAKKITYRVIVLDMLIPQTRKRVIAGSEFLVEAVASALDAMSRTNAKPTPRDAFAPFEAANIPVWSGGGPLPVDAQIKSGTDNNSIKQGNPTDRKHRPIRDDEMVRSLDTAAYTVTTKCLKVYVPSTKQVHQMTVAGLGALQGLTVDEYLKLTELGLSDTALRNMIGDAVPPPLGKLILRCAREELKPQSL